MLLNRGGGDKNVHSHIPVQHGRTNLHMEGLFFSVTIRIFCDVCSSSLLCHADRPGQR